MYGTDSIVTLFDNGFVIYGDKTDDAIIALE